MSVEKVLRITPEERIAIKMAYDRTEEEIEEDVQHLKDWMKKQPHLPLDNDVKMLRAMLVYNKFSLEKTKKKLDMFYSIRNFVPEIFENRDPLNPRISKQLDNEILTPLPNLTPDHHRIIVFSNRNEDVSKFDMESHSKLLFVLLDVKLADDLSLGDHYIVDGVKTKLGHIVQFTPLVIKKYYTIIQKAYSDQIKGVHFVNLPPGGTTVVQICNSLLSKKLANRVHLHSDAKMLLDYFPANILPEEYGGSAGDLMDIHAEWKKYIKCKSDWIIKLSEKKSDESRRTGSPIDSDELFGVSGSFRQLNVD